MYEELVKRLRRCAQFKCRECEYEQIMGCRAKLDAEAADAIEVLSKTEKTTRWISVTERLPERGYYVLVYEDGDILMASYADGNWVLRDMYEIIDDLKPTHWMPLPEPPKEET